MESDIVERLRDLAACKHSDLSIAEEAADEIEKLRAAVEEIYKSSHQVHIIEIARAALEGE